LPDDALFCSVCGTELSRTADPASDAAEIALASANLLRVRKQFEEAEKRCVEVLRADPNNVHAHSLLGDIYRDQGRLEDAREWYQMALDLNPSSRADREKLAAVNRITAATGTAGSDNEPLSIAGLRSSSVVRWLAAVLAVLFLGAIAAIIIRGAETPGIRKRSDVGSAVVRASPAPQEPDKRAGAADRTSRGTLPGEAMTDASREAELSTEAEESLLDREAHLEQLLAEQNPWAPGSVTMAVVLTNDGRHALVFAYGVFTDMAPLEEPTALKALRTVQTLFVGDLDVQSVDLVIRAAAPSVPYHTLVRARAARTIVAANSHVQTGPEAKRVFSLWRWTPAWPSEVAAPTTAE